MTESSLPEASDGDLIAACIEQRERLTESFEALYHRHSDAVFRFLISLLHDREKAEDALQEVFFKAYNSLERFDRGRAFRPWIFRIARNHAFDLLRSSKKAGLTLGEVRDEENATSAEHTVTQVARKERQELVQEALQALPTEERSVLVMRHFHGMTAKQIADVLSVSLRTAKYRLRDAARLLSAELNRRDITSLEVV